MSTYLFLKNETVKTNPLKIKKISIQNEPLIKKYKYGFSLIYLSHVGHSPPSLKYY